MRKIHCFHGVCYMIGIFERQSGKKCICFQSFIVKKGSFPFIKSNVILKLLQNILFLEFHRRHQNCFEEFLFLFILYLLFISSNCSIPTKKKNKKQKKTKRDLSLFMGPFE